MLLVLAVAAALWVLGALMGVRRGQRLMVLALLFAVVALIQILLPEGDPLREATGGSLRNWSVALLITGVVLIYRLILPPLRARARARAEAPDLPDPATGDDAQTQGQGQTQGPASFAPAELERYARHIIMREIGGAGQKRLKGAKVLVVGAGGLGSPALMYLAAAGVGTIGVIDDDAVENSNLQRQIIHRYDTIGMPKVFSAQRAIEALNPFVRVLPYNRRLDAATAEALIGGFDLVLDGTDNFDTRYLVNSACVATGTPLIAAAITQWEGQISLYHPAAGGPCYQCVFPQAPAAGLAPSCAEAGVIAPLPGVVGSMMAVEAVKHIARAGETLAGQLLIYDALYAESRRIAVRPRPGCPVCGGQMAPGGEPAKGAGAG
ncbi:molybdopterin biosynthesis protein [Brevirhabdus pacifica]|uniref:Molybdopterin-synthase adenylyltransferase n=1 Tax=Brevirhabdus pacifica TaxID=1267768 RepID=A0A1U7DJS7_9RHOB|nr:molybdopterin-synthase adenylyltransferase MoeB [Brevirhabdus pacifica]APX90250.1 molybdopterin biosynthesis protein [Brevirhabdus pacifica]OWU78703.1 molybdopterin biosynthesis protein [Loktanella sp. 22II-4b]PJJ80689.1 molybdopterin/thiamine biosynthesis adenylyltransferase [Brevirhabdus pacifica]